MAKISCCDCNIDHSEECPDTKTDTPVLAELLPCPWCGLVPTLRKHFGVHSVNCETFGVCPVQPKLQGTFAIANNAIAAWNQRAL